MYCNVTRYLLLAYAPLAVAVVPKNVPKDGYGEERGWRASCLAWTAAWLLHRCTLELLVFVDPCILWICKCCVRYGSVAQLHFSGSVAGKVFPAGCLFVCQVCRLCPVFTVTVCWYGVVAPTLFSNPLLPFFV